MLIELLLVPIWVLIDLLINLVPEFVLGAYDFLSSSKFLAYGIFLLPPGFWGLFLSSVTFWMSTHFVWGIVEWAYKKIPGIS